jgi:hypothetical protein
MEKLCRLTLDNRQSWRDRVVIVPLAIDDAPEIVARHVRARAWDRIDQYWSGAQGATGSDAPAMRALVGELVPECFLIGRDGRILGRGYPTDTSQSKDVAARIDEALR